MNIPLKDINTKSNYISLFRLLLAIPFVIFTLKIPEAHYHRYIVLGLIMLAYITDILDGYLARKFNEISEAGKIIDPLADKVCLTAFIISLYAIGEIPLYYLLILVLRDLIIFTGGIYITNKIGKVLPSNILGKLTIFFVGVFIIALLLNAKTLPILHNTLLYISIILCFLSVVGYAIRGYQTLKRKKNNETI